MDYMRDTLPKRSLSSSIFPDAKSSSTARSVTSPSMELGRAKRDGYRPVPRCCVACITSQLPHESECSPWVYSPMDYSRIYCDLERSSE